MKKFKNLKKPVRITLYVLIAIIVVLLTLTWIMYAIIEVRKIPLSSYEGYTTTKVIAHRGFSGKYFDNTRQAYEAAGKSTFFDGMETDIRLTTDGVWVCSHDDNPFLDKDIAITKSKYSDIKNLPLDTSKAQKGADTKQNYVIPTYEEYLSICKTYNKIALVEIKGIYSEKDLKFPVELALNMLGEDKVIFGCFKLKSIENVRKIAPNAHVLCFSGIAISAYCFNQMHYNIGVNKSILSKQLVERAHGRNNSEVFVYTTLTKEEYKKFCDMKVDYVISNYQY